jgi:hypothetical protein
MYLYRMSNIDLLASDLILFIKIFRKKINNEEIMYVRQKAKSIADV